MSGGYRSSRLPDVMAITKVRIGIALILARIEGYAPQKRKPRHLWRGPARIPTSQYIRGDVVTRTEALASQTADGERSAGFQGPVEPASRSSLPKRPGNASIV